jgi:hypothetical protein
MVSVKYIRGLDYGRQYFRMKLRGSEYAHGVTLVDFAGSFQVDAAKRPKTQYVPCDLKNIWSYDHTVCICI